MLPVYGHVRALAASGDVSFSRSTSFNLDEYVGLAGDHPQSYRHFMQDELFGPTDFNTEQAHLPDGLAADPEVEAQRYEAAIRAQGVDLQLLGIGMNGHIGFNEPGTPFDSVTHVIELAEQTRQSNAIYFDSIDLVPRQAITMGISTIMAAKAIVLLAVGAAKAEIIARALEGPVDPSCPASILQRHPDVTVILDEEAAAGLTSQPILERA